MKKLLIGLIMWFVACAVIGIAWHQAFGYTYDGIVDPEVFSSWEVVPQFTRPPTMMLKNPDCNAEVRLAIVILQPVPVITPSGIQIYNQIIAYCYYYKNEAVFFALNFETDRYEPDKSVTPEIKNQILNLFRLALNGKEA